MRKRKNFAYAYLKLWLKAPYEFSTQMVDTETKQKPASMDKASDSAAPEQKQSMMSKVTLLLRLPAWRMENCIIYSLPALHACIRPVGNLDVARNFHKNIRQHHKLREMGFKQPAKLTSDPHTHYLLGQRCWHCGFDLIRIVGVRFLDGFSTCGHLCLPP